MTIREYGCCGRLLKNWRQPLIFLLMSLLFFSVCNPGHEARSQEPAHIERPGDQRPELPDFEQKKTPDPIGRPPLPAVPRSESDITSAPRVFVKGYLFEGNTVFSDIMLQRIAEPYTNRQVTFEELQELRHRLTLKYVDEGFINSGAVLPDQKIENGMVTFRMIEGRLSEIEITNTRHLWPSYVSKRLSLGAEPPLNINRLQERVQLIHQNPLIRRINAELSPGLRLGEAVLKARVEEAPPFSIQIEFANDRSPSVGGERGEITLAHRNLIGFGDHFSFSYGYAEGLNDLSVFYRIPLTSRDTSLKLSYDRSDSAVVIEPFDAIDIDSESESFLVGLSRPFYKKPGRELLLSLIGERRHSETYLFGTPYSFSPGAQNGESDVTVLRFSQDWVSQGQMEVMALRSVFSLGMSAMGSTKNDTEPDSRFFTWLGQFQYARRFEQVWNSQLIFRTDVQLSNDPLLSMEKFAVGGATSVRGYRENQLVRDNGLVASLEVRIPVYRVPLPLLSPTSEDGQVQFAIFTDYGWAENTDSPTPDPRTISSAGLGLRWDISRKIHAQFYWGFPFRDVENPGKDIQDNGVHFRIDCVVFEK